MADSEVATGGAEDAAALAARRKEDKERKAAEKAAKAAEKEARQAQRKAAESAKEVVATTGVPAPSVTLRDFEEHKFGNLFIQSHDGTPARPWTPISALTPEMDGQTVWVRARVATSRKQGKKLCFLQLRQSMHTVQVVVDSAVSDGDIVPYAASLPRESVVDVFGKATKAPEPIASCSQSGIEVQVSFAVLDDSRRPLLPFPLCPQRHGLVLHPPAPMMLSPRRSRLRA